MCINYTGSVCCSSCDASADASVIYAKEVKPPELAATRRLAAMGFPVDLPVQRSGSCVAFVDLQVPDLELWVVTPHPECIKAAGTPRNKFV